MELFCDGIWGNVAKKLGSSCLDFAPFVRRTFHCYLCESAVEFIAQRAIVFVAVGVSPRYLRTPITRHVVVPCISLRISDSTTTWRMDRMYRPPWAYTHGYEHIGPLGQGLTHNVNC